MTDDTPLKWCSSCGKFHALKTAEAVQLPDVKPEHYAYARHLARAVWEEATERFPDRGAAISVLGLTAALLTKRLAVTLGVAVAHVNGVAGLYLGIAHEIIARRRAAAGTPAEEPKDMN